MFLFLAEALSTAVTFFLFCGGWGSPAFLYLAGLYFSLGLGHVSFEEVLLGFLLEVVVCRGDLES